MNQEFNDFVQMSKDSRFEIGLARILKEESATFDQQYVFHTAWAARILTQIRPKKHVDISSSIYFNVLVSAFIPMDFYEYNPIDFGLAGLQTGICDLMALPFPDNSIPSLSCMHTVEHIGLGRYGDEIDPEGDLKAISELKRVLAGDLLFVVPIGRPPRVIFNLHRIYSYDQIIDYFSDLELMEFALIPDSGGLVRNATGYLADKQHYGCGCFWFRKE